MTPAMDKIGKGLAITLAVVVLMVLAGAVYKVDEAEQVIITQFGKPVRKPIVTAGLKFKVPFIQKVNRFDRRVLEWDGLTYDMPTKDKLYIAVDTFGRWRIADPLQYFRRLRDERSAQSRLEDILGSETRNAVAKHELIEIIRTSKDREPVVDEVLQAMDGRVGALLPISKGRAKVEEEIFAAASTKLSEFGIELLDIRFKRINYNESVRRKIYDRMISERQQIAERFRSEGGGEAAKILGEKERDLREIESKAYKTIQEIRGGADAKATEIYASAYNKSKDAVELYEFTKSLETYEDALDAKTTLILSSDSDLFRYLKTLDEDGARE
jgi:modulator of FtsH protease HflC